VHLLLAREKLCPRLSEKCRAVNANSGQKS